MGDKCIIYIINYMKKLKYILNYPFLQVGFFFLPDNTSNSFFFFSGNKKF